MVPNLPSLALVALVSERVVHLCELCLDSMELIRCTIDHHGI